MVRNDFFKGCVDEDADLLDCLRQMRSDCGDLLGGNSASDSARKTKPRASAPCFGSEERVIESCVGTDL